MERAGVDVITDGEMRRESYSNRFATALDGVDLERPGVALDRTGHENPVPRVVGPIRRTRPVEDRDVEFLRSLTDRRIKITVPGPFTMTQQAQNDHYPDDGEPRTRVRGGRQRGATRPEGGRRRRRPDRRAVPPGATRAGARVRGRGDQPGARRHRGRHGPAHLLRLRAHRPRPAERLPVPRASSTTARRPTSRSRRRSRTSTRRCCATSPTRRSSSASSTWARSEVETPEVVAARIRKALTVRRAGEARRRAGLRDEVPPARARVPQAPGDGCRCAARRRGSRLSAKLPREVRS